MIGVSGLLLNNVVYIVSIKADCGFAVIKALCDLFFGKLTPGKSLVFFYTKAGLAFSLRVSACQLLQLQLNLFQKEDHRAERNE